MTLCKLDGRSPFRLRGLWGRPELATEATTFPVESGGESMCTVQILLLNRLAHHPPWQQRYKKQNTYRTKLEANWQFANIPPQRVHV